MSFTSKIVALFVLVSMPLAACTYNTYTTDTVAPASSTSSSASATPTASSSAAPSSSSTSAPRVMATPVLVVDVESHTVANSTIVSGGTMLSVSFGTTCDVEIRHLPIWIMGSSPAYKLLRSDGTPFFMNWKVEDPTSRTVMGPVEITNVITFANGTQAAPLNFHDAFDIPANSSVSYGVEMTMLPPSQNPEFTSSTQYYTLLLGYPDRGFASGDVMAKCPGDTAWREVNQGEIVYDSTWGTDTFDPNLR